MYLSTSTGLRPLAPSDEILVEALDVFGGDLTCCRRGHGNGEACDREELMLPILGLYFFPSGRFPDESLRRRGRDVDIPWGGGDTRRRGRSIDTGAPLRYAEIYRDREGVAEEAYGLIKPRRSRADICSPTTHHGL